LRNNEKGCIIKEKFDKFWTNQDSGTFLFTSSDSRLKYLVRKFLTTDNYITQDYLQSILFISQNTLYSDFRTLKNHFSSYNLKLVNKSNLGYIVNGLEQDKRKAIIDLIFKTTSQQNQLLKKIFVTTLITIHSLLFSISTLKIV